MKLKLLALVVLPLVFFGCKEDEKVDSASYFSVNGQNVSLHQGFLFDYGTNPDLISRDYDIVLTTQEITYDADLKEMIGTGSFVFFDLNIDGTEQFVPGTFSWAASSGPNTMIGAFAGITCSFESEICSYSSFADGGSVTVEVDGNIYTVNFEIDLKDGQTATGYFKGPLNFR